MTVNVTGLAVAGALVTSICSLSIWITSFTAMGSVPGPNVTGTLVAAAVRAPLSFTFGLYACSVLLVQLAPSQLAVLAEPMQMPP